MPDIRVSVNGRELAVPSGSVAAIAIALAGYSASRRSISGEPRGPLCGMGICFECRATINGIPHVRTCQYVCEPGMEIQTGE